MKKETVVKFLANFCVLLPGNVSSRKRWFISPLSILCLVTLLAVAMLAIGEIVGYQNFIRDNNMKNAVKNLKYIPARPIGFCLKPLKKNATLIASEDKNGIFVKVVPNKDGGINSPNSNGTAGKANKTSTPKHPMSDLENIVSTAYRLEVVAMNIIIRVFLWITFSSLIELLESIFSPPRKQATSYNTPKNGWMSLLWYEACQRWSSGEKVFLFIISVSLLQREGELFTLFYSSIVKTGLELLDIPCLFVQLLIEQAKVVFSTEMPLEICGFVLVIVMKAFANVLRQISGTKGDRLLEDDDEYTGNRNPAGFFGDEIGNGNQFRSRGIERQTSDMLFVRTRAMLIKSDRMNENRTILGNGGINTIDEQISGIIGNGDYEGEFRIPNKKTKFYGESHQSTTTTAVAADVIYSQINFVITMYFDLMGTWERASKFTGFVTLVLFCELTTTFCFNTYITLDYVMKYGLFSEFGANGVIRGVVIVTKLVCVCNAAQTLHDMTPSLLEHLLELKLRLLSLPSESFIGRNVSGKIVQPSDLLDENLATTYCARCRGLGSFLSEMVSYIRAHPFELSALGYFTVSRSTLTTITGVIVTYLVVLVQFQSYASSSK